jgi:hypothetical protein
MKTKIAQYIVFIIMVLFSFGAIGQENIVDKQEDSSSASIEDIVTILKSGKTYELHTGTRGGVYIIRVSGSTGKEYKQYINRAQLVKLINNYALVKSYRR